MGAQHSLQRTRHGICPEEIMIQRTVCIYPLAGIQRQQFVDQITGVLVLDVGLQPLLDPPLDVPGDLDPVVEVQRLHIGPDLG